MKTDSGTTRSSTNKWGWRTAGFAFLSALIAHMRWVVDATFSSGAPDTPEVYGGWLIAAGFGMVGLFGLAILLHVTKRERIAKIMVVLSFAIIGVGFLAGTIHADQVRNQPCWQGYMRDGVCNIPG